MRNKITKSKLIRKINALASSCFELIIIDTTTRAAYRRNTDWEWAGGNLYNEIGKVPEEAFQGRFFHPNVSMHENFAESIVNDRWVPVTVTPNFYNQFGGLI